MCSFEKSKKPSPIPTLLCTMTCSRSDGEKRIASPNRVSQPCGESP